MKALKFLVVLVLTGAAFGAGFLLRGARDHGAAPAAPSRTVLYWVDPMHPAYKSDRPGIAPDCGMTLKPVYADDGGTAWAAQGAERKVLYYRDPKAPSFRADRPGLNPETGNDLEPVYADEPATIPAGTVRITPERQQIIGVKFAEVLSETGMRQMRTVGQVTVDETRIAHVHTRVDGWIERVLVDFTGDVVRKGQPMLTVYSPEMLASQQELLLAAKARETMAGNPLEEASKYGDSLFAAARRRLQLWDLSDAQIDQVLATGTPIRNITVEAPVSGYVTERNAFPNQRVTPESDLYTIVDLSHVWVLADVFESDIAFVKLGGTAKVTLPYAQQAPLAARINYIQPQVDPTTRALKVRLDVGNPGMRLKPNMYVDVDVSVPQAEHLTVPADAVLDTGGRQTVFVDRGNGYLEPRAVMAGERTRDRVTILSGLAAGERVVASGTFLVDSESQLKAAAADMGAPAGHAGHGAAPSPATPAPSKAPPVPAGPGTHGEEPHHD